MSETLTAKVRRMHSPVNRLAASVIGPGIRYEEDIVVLNELVSEVPLPTRPYPPVALAKDNIAGMKAGRFTVIGLAADVNSSWVVKCSCGRYCYRKARTLKKPRAHGEHDLMCGRCVQVEHRKTGKRPDDAKSALHGAALPMYRALEEILRLGLTLATPGACA